MPDASALHEVTIASLGGLGDGIASLGGKPLFIPKSVPGDRILARILQESREGLRGEIVTLLAPGPERMAAPCQHFAECGGCGLQQLSDDAYQRFKRGIVRSALDYAGFPESDFALHFLPAATRRRVEFKVKQAPFALALHAGRSHRLHAISQCLILAPALQALLLPLTQALSALSFAPSLAGVKLTQADSGIDIVLDVSALPPKAAQAELLALAERLDIARLSLRLPHQPVAAGIERRAVTMRLGGYAISLPPDAFLQATVEGQALLTQAALEATRHAASVADLFCGIGSYSFPLSAQAFVHAVESESGMVRALQGSIAKYGLTARMRAEQRDLFKHPLSAQELARFDAAILNPPRLGARAQTEQLAASRVSRILLISCNPATFSRDANSLKTAGFRLESAFAIDQFVYSAHLEIAAVFTR